MRQTDKTHDLSQLIRPAAPCRPDSLPLTFQGSQLEALANEKPVSVALTLNKAHCE